MLIFTLILVLIISIVCMHGPWNCDIMQYSFNKVGMMVQ